MLYKSISLEKQLLMKIGSPYYETNKQIISKTNIVDLVSKSTFKAHDRIALKINLQEYNLSIHLHNEGVENLFCGNPLLHKSLI